MPFISICFGWISACAAVCINPADSIPVQDTLPGRYMENKWIEKITGYGTIKVTHSSDLETISLLTPDKDIHLSPNTSAIKHVSVSYRFVTAGFKVAPKFWPGNGDSNEKGKTSAHGLGLGFSFRHWQQELSYSRIKGYYLENTSDYDPDWKEGMPYIQFPGLVMTNYQGVTAYNFNRKFSVNAVLTQSERQLKSAGSFIPLLLYRYYIIDDRSEPATAGGATQKSNNFEILAGAGYQHTFVLKDFYFSLGITPGFGYVFTKLTTRYSTGNEISRNHTPAFRLDARTGLGYNAPRFFTGAYMNVISNASRQQHTAVINSDDRLIFRVFIGYRFRAPKFIVRKMDQLTEKGRQKLDHLRKK